MATESFCHYGSHIRYLFLRSLPHFPQSLLSLLVTLILQVLRHTACSYLRAFAHAVSAAWNALPQDLSLQMSPSQEGLPDDPVYKVMLSIVRTLTAPRHTYQLHKWALLGVQHEGGYTAPR